MQMSYPTIRGKFTALALLAILVGSIAAITGQVQPRAYAEEHMREGAADFVANIEFIRGHLEKAVENKNAGQIELAVAHAGHPVEEVYALVESDISEADPSLNTQLKDALTALPNQANTSSAAEFESAAQDIGGMLDDAMAAVVGTETDDPAMWASVIVLLLKTAELEYGEAVDGGQVVEMIEYQDASAFIHRAQVAFESIKTHIPEHEAEEIQEFFADLDSQVTSNAPPENVATLIGGIAHEFDEVFGLTNSVNQDAVAFAANIEMIKGHMYQAMKNKINNNTDLALAHAGHPIEEHFALIEAEINEHDSELGSGLKAALTNFANNIDEVSVGEARVERVGIIRMLNSAMDQVIPEEARSDVRFRVSVINTLLETVEEEYSEAIEGGEITEMIEYQDADAFKSRAWVNFRDIGHELPAQEVREARQLMLELRKAIKDADGPESIGTIVRGIVHELGEAAGVEETGETTPLQYIERIKELMTEILVAYESESYSEADRLAVEAYLNNFEHVERPLEEAGEGELMEEIENLMRVQLRQMIADRAPPGDLEDHIETINEKLSLAEEALSS